MSPLPPHTHPHPPTKAAKYPGSSAHSKVSNRCTSIGIYVQRFLHTTRPPRTQISRYPSLPLSSLFVRSLPLPRFPDRANQPRSPRISARSSPQLRLLYLRFIPASNHGYGQSKKKILDGWSTVAMRLNPTQFLSWGPITLTSGRTMTWARSGQFSLQRRSFATTFLRNQFLDLYQSGSPPR